MERERESGEVAAPAPVAAATRAELGPGIEAPGRHARVLGLHRRLGNRGVVALLRETDPRLTYTQPARDEAKGLDAQALPWRTPGDQGAGWDALAILGRLTQVDDSGATFTDDVRCGANSVLAVAILRGPLDTEAFARGVMLQALAKSKDAKQTAEGRATMGQEYLDIWPAIRAVGNGTATYGDLSSIAHHAKVVMSDKPRGATTGHEVTAMASLVGGMQSSGAPIEDREHLRTFVRDLKAREAYILMVDTDVLDPKTKVRSTTQTNHFVMLGKDDTGKTFLYDPFPRVGTQIFRSTDPSFWTLFETAEGVWKSSYVFVRPRLG